MCLVARDSSQPSRQAFRRFHTPKLLAPSCGLCVGPVVRTQLNYSPKEIVVLLVLAVLMILGIASATITLMYP